MNGQIPGDQEAAVQAALGNAAAAIRVWKDAVASPFQAVGARSERWNGLLNRLDRYTQATEGRNYTQKAAYLDGSRQMLRSLVSETFVSSRLDALRAQANCDTFVVDACYNFGKAEIASNFVDRASSEYRGAALGSMRLAMREGLAIAMDFEGHLPFDGHRRKVCCTFGTPTEWAAFLKALDSSNPFGIFAASRGTLLRIIEEAVLLDPVCLTNPWDRAADAGDNKGGEKQEGRKKELGGALISRGENALSRCDFAGLEQILNQLAALAPGDPRYQSLRARAAQFRRREQDGLNLLREAGSYADLDRTVQILKQAQQTFPCPKPEVNQAIGSVIKEAADQRRGVDVEQARAKQAAWTSVLGGIIQSLEEASKTQSGGGTSGTGGTTGGTGTTTGGAKPAAGTPACTLDTRLMSGSSKFCASYLEFLDPEGSRIIVHILNESVTSIPPNFRRGRFNTCEEVLRYESEKCH
jgi:hypothetical protein